MIFSLEPTRKPMTEKELEEIRTELERYVNPYYVIRYDRTLRIFHQSSIDFLFDADKKTLSIDEYNIERYYDLPDMIFYNIDSFKSLKMDIKKIIAYAKKHHNCKDI